MNATRTYDIASDKIMSIRQQKGNTDIGKALQHVRTKIMKNKADRITAVVVVTDGTSKRAAFLKNQAKLLQKKVLFCRDSCVVFVLSAAWNHFSRPQEVLNCFVYTSSASTKPGGSRQSIYEV